MIAGILRRMFGGVSQDDRPSSPSPAIGRERITCPTCKASYRAEPNMVVQFCPHCGHAVRANTPTFQRSGA